MDVSEPELTSLFAAWCQDIDSEPFRYADELDAAVRRWAYRRRYLSLVVRLVASTSILDDHDEPGLTRPDHSVTRPGGTENAGDHVPS